RDREPAIAPERAQRIADVADGVAQRARAAPVPVLLLRALDAAEVDPRPAKGFMARMTLAHVKLGLLLDVEADLVLELSLCGARLKHRAREQSQAGKSHRGAS